jgi:hypothetical protein
VRGAMGLAACGARPRLVARPGGRARTGRSTREPPGWPRSRRARAFDTAGRVHRWRGGRRCLPKHGKPFGLARRQLGLSLSAPRAGSWRLDVTAVTSRLRLQDSLPNSHIAHALKHSGPLQDIGSNHPFCPLSRMLSCSFQPRADRSPFPAQPWLAPPVTRPRVRPALCRSRRAPRRPPPAGAGRAPLWCGSGCPRQVPAARTCDRPVRRTRVPTGLTSR